MRLSIYYGTEWQKKHAKGFGRWYVHNYIPKGVRRKLSVSVVLFPNIDSWKRTATDKHDLAYCEYLDEDRSLGKEHCRISLYSPHNLLYYKFMSRLAHEFVHVKQYVTHELKDDSNGTSFRKQKFKDDSTLYWNQPWEIEAMGFEYGLIKMYCDEAGIKNEVFTREVKRII